MPRCGRLLLPLHTHNRKFTSGSILSPRVAMTDFPSATKFSTPEKGISLSGLKVRNVDHFYRPHDRNLTPNFLPKSTITPPWERRKYFQFRPLPSVWLHIRLCSSIVGLYEWRYCTVVTSGSLLPQFMGNPFFATD